MYIDEPTVKIPEYNFGTLEFCSDEGNGSTAISISNTESYDFEGYCDLLKSEGFEIIEEIKRNTTVFRGFQKDKNSVFVSLYPEIGEMRIVTEQNTSYFDFLDTVRIDKQVSSSVTQINLGDFGMSYVIRLNDGRFILFDGGWDWEVEADKLMDCLRERAGGDEIVIAAWFLTHPHLDHFWCFNTFYDKYGKSVTIEKMFFNFPEYFADGLKEKMPGVEKEYARKPEHFYNLFANLNDSGAELFVPHTGQQYLIGNALCEILSSPDDVLYFPLTDANPMSLVVKMTIENQVIMWFADTYFEPTKIIERFGSYLKSDIMQIPHHGFVGGTVEGYEVVDPRVVLAPTFDTDAFGYFNIHKTENQHLYLNMNVEEFIFGVRYDGEDKTIDLPYTPKKTGKKELEKMVEDGLGSCGAKNWVFNDVVVEDGGKCVFSILNPTVKTLNVYLDVFYENPSDNVTDICITAKPRSLTSLDLNDPSTFDGDSRPYDRRSAYVTKGLKYGVPAAMKFVCNTPVVISKKGETAAYNY